MLSIEDFPQLILFIVTENNDVQTARNVLRIFRNKAPLLTMQDSSIAALMSIETVH